MNKLLIAIPTYNEKENVLLIIEEINKYSSNADLLFIDDHSPDGTGEILEKISKTKKNLHIIHRKGKSGIGSAHQAGIQYAFQKKYDFLITMDCDFSHPPEFIPDLLPHAEENDIVLGSRYLKNDSLSDWNPFRKFLTYTGHFLTSTLLGMPYDASNAFRLYNLRNIPHGIFSLVESKSYSFFFESLFILSYNGFKIKEIPMHIPKRTYGHSKMTFKDIYRSLKLLGEMFFRKIVNKKSLSYGK